jgi:hypothetical protein
VQVSAGVGETTMTKVLLLSIAVLAGLSGCDRSESKAPADEASDGARIQRVAAGSIYAFRGTDGKYTLSKVIVVDDFALHVRSYSDTFDSPPASVDTSKLAVSIGHAPIDKDGFLADKPVFVQTEAVRDADLEGYKVYLEMTNQ